MKLNRKTFSNRDFSEIAEELIYSVLPLIFCLVAVVFKAFSLGVVRFLIVSLLIGSVMLVIRRVRMDWKDGKLAGIMVTIGFLGWYAIPAFINLFSQGTPYRAILPVSVDEETTIWALIYLSSFLVTWILGSHFFERVRFFPPVFSNFSSDINPAILVWMGIIFCVAGFVPYVFSGLGIFEVVSLIFQGRLVEKPWLHWENLGNYRSAFLFVSHSGMAAGACVLWVTTQEKKFSIFRKTSVGLFALIVTLVIFFDQGTRSIIALIVLPVLLVKFFDSSKHSRFRFLVIVSALGLMFLVFLQIQLYFRGGGSFTGIPQLAFYKWITLEDTTDLFSETLFSIKIVPSLHDFFRESVFFQFLVSPIPRFLWSSKPVSQVVWFYTLRRWGIDVYEGAGNVFPGIVGQFYMSWGGWGPILLGGFMGWLSSRVDGYLLRTSNTRHPYYRAVGLMMSVWILLSFRVISPGFLYPVAMVFLLIKISSDRKTSCISNGFI